MTDNTPISDRIKQAVDDLDLETKLSAAVEAGEQAVLRGVELAGDYTHQHQSDIDGLLDRARAFVDARTDGRYADQVGRVRSQLSLGVARLAERRTVADEGTAGPQHLADPET